MLSFEHGITTSRTVLWGLIEDRSSETACHKRNGNGKVKLHLGCEQLHEQHLWLQVCKGTPDHDDNGNRQTFASLLWLAFKGDSESSGPRPGNVQEKLTAVNVKSISNIPVLLPLHMPLLSC